MIVNLPWLDLSLFLMILKYKQQKFQPECLFMQLTHRLIDDKIVIF